MEGTVSNYSLSKSFVPYKNITELIPNSSFEKKSLIFLISSHVTDFEPFKRQSHKMVKDTQAICRLLPTNFFSVWRLKPTPPYISSTQPTEVIFRYLFFDLHFKAIKRMNLFNLSRNNTPILEFVSVRYSLRRLRSQEVDIDFKHFHS